MKDLYYNVTTKEGIVYSFELKAEGLYAYKVKQNKDGNVFGKEIIDNKIQSGDAIYRIEIGLDHSDD